MGLFGKKEKGKKDMPSFPSAINSLGIKSEAELKERAKIMLNDKDGIMEIEPNYQLRMNAYKSGDTVKFLEFKSPVGKIDNMLRFSGYIDGANNISFCYDLSEVGFDKMKENAAVDAFSVKLIFFPTESTPHFTAKIAINDGTLNQQGSISPLVSDINFDMSSLFNRLVIYELIVFPVVKIHFIDERYRGAKDFPYDTWEFSNSLAVRAGFLREAEAFIHSLNDYSVFSNDATEAADEYISCFDPEGNPISAGARDHYLRRKKYSPAPVDPIEWTMFSV